MNDFGDRPNGVNDLETNSLTRKTLLSEKAECLLKREIPFITHEEFHRMNEDSDSEVTASLIGELAQSKEDSDDDAVIVFGRRAKPLLSVDEERVLFRRMNFLRYRVNQARTRLNPRRPAATLITQIEWQLAEAEAIRERLVESNLRLVLSIARRLSKSQDDFDEFVSDSLLVLLGAIEKFDFSKGFRFSTYATHAIQRHIFRLWKRQQRRNQRCSAIPDEILQEVPMQDRPSADLPYRESAVKQLLARADACLDERERSILRARFGFGGPERTLRDLAEEMGLSKERIRQLQIRAMGKLRDLAGELQLSPA